MTNRSAVLHKKLQELESELTDIFDLPPGPTAAHLEISFDDVKNRFRFLNTLLSTEVASQPHDSDQLHEIGRRLASLKAAFRNWNASRLTNCSASNNLDDTLSVCSDCTQTLLNDDVSHFESPILNPEIDFSGEFDRFSDCVDHKDGDLDVEREKVAGKIWGRVLKYSGVFGCGMIVGAICMVKLFMSFDHDFVQCDVSFIPPT